MRTLHANPPQDERPSGYLPNALITSTHGFVRVDGIQTPLQPPYAGRFCVVKPGPKTFILDVAGRQDTVSTDFIKPANVNEDQTEDSSYLTSSTILVESSQ